jgi:hypothetical protein
VAVSAVSGGASGISGPDSPAAAVTTEKPRAAATHSVITGSSLEGLTQPAYAGRSGVALGQDA